ncbi:MAG TPA: D-alanyl-D-alanine carboxypeptidase, partial [Candidatus Binatia bacterium]|nr:D-alanyl-D-alanine carboxypeptidase [Candidatus Binatia bacterium]
DAAGRNGWPASERPAIAVRGGIRRGIPQQRTALLTHRSETLATALHRFNVFSNNDIERLDASVGGPPALAAFLSERWGQAASGIRFETTSGLHSNRMTPRQVVRLMRELHLLLQQHGLELGNVLPVMGCGDSTLRHLFPRLRENGKADGFAGKTGTLNTTDGGVSALAGLLPAKEPVLFFVAAPGAGNVLERARAAEEDWLTRLIAQSGPLEKPRCPPQVKTSDIHAQVVVAAGPSAATP